ncbi:MAG: hypothetical protein ACXWMC_05695 [Syntrophales bacterium]
MTVLEGTQSPGGVHLPLGLILTRYIKTERPNLVYIMFGRHGEKRIETEIPGAFLVYISFVAWTDMLAAVIPINPGVHGLPELQKGDAY